MSRIERHRRRRSQEAPPVAEGLDAGHLAVLAHAMLGSTAVVCGTVRTLRARLEVLDHDAQRELLDAVEQHGVFMAEVLGLLARGLPASALDAVAHPPRP